MGKYSSNRARWEYNLITGAGGPALLEIVWATGHMAIFNTLLKEEKNECKIY